MSVSQPAVNSGILAVSGKNCFSLIITVEYTTVEVLIELNIAELLMIE